MPRIAADPASVAAAFADAIASGLVPPPADRGGPVAGLAVQTETDGSVVVLGGVNPVRVSARSAPRLRAILSGAVDARPDEITMLHRLGLWGGAVGASPESVFLSRRAASTRRHSGGDEAATAMHAVQVRVVGESALAGALRELLNDGCPGACPAEIRGAPADASGPSATVELAVDTDLATDAVPIPTHATVVVRTTATGVMVGPWVEAGERPCFDCVAAATDDSVAVPPASAARVRSAAAIAALELANTTAGVGRTIRPGVVVDHDLEAGASRMSALAPRPDCRRCSGPEPDRGTRVRTDAEALAGLSALLLNAPPPRRWRPPAEHELHLTAAALRPQHHPASSDPPSSPAALAPFARAMLMTGEKDGVITRAQPSAGNLGAATLVARGFGLAVSVDLDRLRPKYGSAADALGLADAGALLGALAVRAHRSDEAIAVLDDAVHVEPSRLLGPTIGVVPSVDGSGGAAGADDGAVMHERDRSIRDPVWTDADTHTIERVEAVARALLPLRAEIRLDLLRPDGSRVDGWPTRAPSADAACAASAGVTGVRDCIAQACVGQEAALLVATVDLRATTSLDRCRHDAATLLGAVAALASEDGLRGCLVHGLVPDSVSDALGGGLLSSFPLFGWLCGREGGIPE